MNRSERRRDAAETRALFEKIREEHHTRRRSGKWPPWEQMAVAPGEIGGGGWSMEVHTAWRNELYAVLVRTIETAWGPCEHACISTLHGYDISWRDKQRIKNELFGNERTALEVFPAESDLVDGANSYHLWVFGTDFRLPFSIGRRGDAL